MNKELRLSGDKVKSLLLAASLTSAIASLICDILFSTTRNGTFLGLALATLIWTLAFGFIARPLDRKRRKKARETDSIITTKSGRKPLILC